MTAEWREFAARTPVVTTASDDALAALFPERDGRWSPLIKAAMTAFETEALDLNQAWAETPQAWFCSCCGRAKAQILRKSKAGVLLAHLHEHHDHLHALIAHKLRKVFGAHWVSGIPQGTYHLEHLGSQLIERFERVLVCADCNLAEAEAKRSLKNVDPYFSFRPSEIRRFSTIAPNNGHRVDLAVAQAIWEAELPEFRRRVALAGQLAKLVVDGAFLRERSRSYGGAFGPGYVSAEARDLLRRMTLDVDTLEAFRAENAALLSRSVSRGPAGASRPKPPRSVRIPTEQDVLSHDGGQYPQYWAMIDDVWRCRGCDRSRAGILRASRKPGRRWSGHVQPHREYDWGPGADEHDPALVVGHRTLLICDGCAGLGARFKQRESDAFVPGFNLQIEQLRRCLEVEDHRQHGFSDDALRLEIEEARLRWGAEAEYDRMLREAASARGTFNHFLGEEHGDPVRSWRRTVSYLRKSALDEPMADAGARIRSLIETADRLDLLESGVSPVPPAGPRTP